MNDGQDPGDQTGPAHPKFRDVPVSLSIVVGRARLSVGELLSLEKNAIVALDSRIDEPVAILAGDRIVAHGELQEIEEEAGRLAVRITGLPADGDDTE